MQRNNFMGLDGFVWFMGVVENRNDPLMLGRVQIRAFGWHTDDKISIPTQDLPWAQPMFSTNGSMTTNAPKEGDYVVGFFTDGDGAQFPILLGVLPGIPDLNANQSKGFADPREKADLDDAPVKPTDRRINSTNGTLLKVQDRTPYPRDINEPSTSKLARNELLTTTVIDFRKKNWIEATSTGGSSWKEPYPGYSTVYPYSQTTETESGHIFQLDDTPGNERIMLTHRTGTTSEVYNSGTKLEKIVKDNYTIVHGSDFCYVNGKLELTVENVAKIRIKGKTTIEIDGDVDWKIGGQMNVSVGADLNFKTGGKVNWDVATDIEQVTGGSYHAKAGGSYDAKASGRIAFDGSTSHINSGLAPGTTVTGLVSPNPYTNPTETQIIPEKIKPVANKYPPISANEVAPNAVANEDQVPNQPPANTEFVSSSTDCFTLPMLKAAAPSTSDSVLTSFLPGLNKICAKYLINTQLRKAHFLAQVAHESGGFKFLKEGYNGTPETYFAKYDPPGSIAKNLGNTQVGDGPKFFGRGLIQLTGRYNYTAFASSIGMSVEDVIPYLESIDGAIEASAWYWSTHRGRLGGKGSEVITGGNRISDRGAGSDIVSLVTYFVNGGQNGYADRLKRFNACYPVCV